MSGPTHGRASRGRAAGGIAILVVTAAIALEATTFDVAFPTDPLGPKAFPLVAAFLMAFGGFALIARGREARSEPTPPAAGEAAGAARTGAPPAVAVTSPAARIALATASFVVYALLLAPLGFVIATTLEFTVLVRVFGGPVVRGAAAGLAFSLLLYALFVYALGLPLPLGILAR